MSLEKKLFVIGICVLGFLSILEGCLLYREIKTNNTYKTHEISNNKLIDYLRKDNIKLKKENQNKQDSLTILILNNIKDNDKKINYINSLSDSAKVRLLSRRYNLHY